MRDEKLMVALLGALCVVAGAPVASVALAQEKADEVRSAPSATTGIDGTIFHAQVLLDRAGFAPGVIDGKKGMSFEEAIKGFQTARGLDMTGVLDTPTRRALLTDKAPSTRRLRIDASDAVGPFVRLIPDDPVDQARMEHLGYRNLLEKVAEKFHTTPATIIALNRPDMALKAGTVLRLPNVLPSSRDYGDVPAEAAKMLSNLNVSGDLPEAERIVVDKSDGVLRLYGEGDRLLAQFPATMGSTHDPLPLGNWRVTSIAYNPPFHFQPELFWDVADEEDEQRIPPGPNGPIGIVWIDLSKENYGIHGTSAPETIQRAQSHGCVRLTNWDAARVSQMASDGMPVIFQA